MKKIILYSSDEGDIVFDPFLGSGTVAVAAKILNRRFLGFEIVPEYYEFTRGRIERTERELLTPKTTKTAS